MKKTKLDTVKKPVAKKVTKPKKTKASVVETTVKCDCKCCPVESRLCSFVRTITSTLCAIIAKVKG